MSHSRIKLAVAMVSVAAAVSYLAFAGIRKASLYYVDVDTLLAESRYHDQRLRLCGTVGEEDFAAIPGQLKADFTLLGKAARVPVRYEGVVPDTLRASSEVVVEGRLIDGVFQADVLLTKCASKYKPADAVTPSSPAGARPVPASGAEGG